MSARTSLRRVIWRWLAPVVGIAALALAAYLFLHGTRQQKYRLTITAGNRLGTREELADILRQAVAPEGLTLELRESVGSEEALDWVEAGKVDLALVQGGLSRDGRPNVREAAALQVEPLHLLVKPELFPAVSKHLSALEGKTVNTGEVGSGTHTLSVKVLEFAGLQPRGQDSTRGYIPMPLSRQQMLAEETASRLPDAIFVLSSLPSRAVMDLVHRHGYRLVPLPFGEAFALGALTDEDRHSRGEEDHGIDRARTFAAMIPPFAYGVEPPVPLEPLPSLGNRLLLVAHKDVPAQAINQLIEAVYTSEFAKTIRPPLDSRQMDLPPEFPWHAGAVLYQKRNKPLVSGEVMDSTHKALAAGAAALSGLFVVWQWLKLRAASGRDKAFKRYIHAVTRIEEQAARVERAHPGDRGALSALQVELSRLKMEALDRFTEGQLEGRELMAAFLAHVADTREYLTRLLSVEREAWRAAPEER
jgi:TRAP-type uncharacterized transport system substrate-binding protein